MSTDSLSRRFLAAVSYLTIFPLSKREEDTVDFLAYFPLVGFLLGCFLLLCAHLFEEAFYPAINALFIVSILTVVTRGRHLDSLAAILDGLTRGKDVRGKRTIMLEHQRGSFGVMCLVLAILAKYLLISHLVEAGSFHSLLLFPTVGRWAMICLAWFFPVTPEDGFVGYPTSRDFLWATGITLLCSILTHRLVGLGIVVLAWILIYGIGHYFVKRINKGITVQVMEASVELVEILALSLLVALLGGF
jgi:adenosylcobinamide-GDP ribazoletransferase